MATKSHKKKKDSAPNPSINAKAAASDKKPKTPKPIEEQPEQAAAAADKKPKKQKAKDEIDEIFSAAKAGKKRKPEEAEAQGGKRKKPKERIEGGSSKKKSNKTPGSKGKGRVADNDEEEFVEKRSRRRTNDGLVIYSAEELGFGKADAGGTPLCPFDCDCCF